MPVFMLHKIGSFLIINTKQGADRAFVTVAMIGVYYPLIDTF